MQSNEATIRQTVAVPMRDGLALATDLHLPANRREPIPALLQRTPYDKTAEARREEAAFFAAQGYAVAVQDCRGTHASPGEFTKYTADGRDGYDTVEWLAAQDWCNGKVGTYGLSYAAHAQAALACLNPPHLGCMWLECGGFSDAFLSACRNGGAFELRQATWAFREAMESLRTAAGGDSPSPEALAGLDAMEGQDVFAWFRRMPWKKGHGPLQWAPDYENYLLELWSNEEYSEYWKQAGLSVQSHLKEFSDVPQVHMGAWYDPYARTTTDNFVALSQRGGRGPVYLIMGPWTHGGHGLSYSGDADFGPNSTLQGNLAEDYNHLRLSFFDHWLKGEDSGWDAEPRVRLFVMGGGTGRRNPEGRLDHGGQWREEGEWPLGRANPTRFHLHSGGLLSTDAPEVDDSYSSYRYEPDNPVPTIGGNISSGQPVMYPGGFDQRESAEFYGCREPYLPLTSRADVLVYQTGPLPQGLEVAGPIQVTLWVQSTGPDTDFTAKLVDVYPPSADYPEGYALNISDGILRAKFRDSWDSPTLMEQGGTYRLTIDLPPTANFFAAGHRVRLDISSSNFPRFDVNGNSGENPAWSQVRRPVENTVYHDREHPSHALLPVAPRAN